MIVIWKKKKKKEKKKKWKPVYLSNAPSFILLEFSPSLSLSLSLSVSLFFLLAMMSICGRAATTAITTTTVGGQTARNQGWERLPLLAQSSSVPLGFLWQECFTYFLRSCRAGSTAVFLEREAVGVCFPCGSCSHSATKHVFIPAEVQTAFPFLSQQLLPQPQTQSWQVWLLRGARLLSPAENSESLSENKALPWTVASAVTLFPSKLWCWMKQDANCNPVTKAKGWGRNCHFSFLLTTQESVSRILVRVIGILALYIHPGIWVHILVLTALVWS